MRISSAVLLALALGACDKRGGEPLVEGQGRDKVPCALEGAADFDAACPVERVQGADGLELVLRHPDGGFRRLLVTGDGRGVAAADGAEPAIVSMGPQGGIEVAIGRDRYRLPATVSSPPR